MVITLEILSSREEIITSGGCSKKEDGIYIENLRTGKIYKLLLVGVEAKE